jgi:hypothetical protein
VDAQVLGEDCELARLTVFGETLEDAIVSTLAMLAPHVQAGSTVQVLNTGVFCEECQAYHPCTERLIAQHGVDVHLEPPESSVGPN